jgi:hypothetical protein
MCVICADQGGGTPARDRDHLRQPGGCGAARRNAAERPLTVGMVIGFSLVLAGSILATGGTPEAVAEP